MLVDLGDDLVRELLELLLGPVELVLGDVAVLLERLELLAGVAADVAHRDPALLGPVLHHLHQLLAAVLGELPGTSSRMTTPSFDGVDAEVALLDRLLDRLDRALVVGRDHEDPGLGDAEARRAAGAGPSGAVVVDLELLDQAGRGPPGADARRTPPAGGSTALCILSLASSSESHLVAGVAMLAYRLASSSRACRSARRRAPGWMLPGCGHVEDDDRQLVVHAERDRGRVHHLEAAGSAPRSG